MPTRENLAYRIRDRLFALMHRNATNASDFFSLPSQRVVEVGSRVNL
jgi:KUP system potassium uptake protein